VTAIDDLMARDRVGAEYHPAGLGPMPTLKLACWFAWTPGSTVTARSGSCGRRCS